MFAAVTVYTVTEDISHLDTFVTQASKGDTYIYYLGDLSRDRVRGDRARLVEALGYKAWWLYTKGHVQLVRRRLDEHLYAYEMRRL